MNIVFFILFVGFLVALIALITQVAAIEKHPEILLRIENEFQTLVVDNPLPELSFDGRTAQIVHDRQEGDDHEGGASFSLHRIHRFARNAYGEYFLFISDGSGKSFFKHVSQSNARIALGDKYMPL